MLMGGRTRVRRNALSACEVCLGGTLTTSGSQHAMRIWDYMAPPGCGGLLPNKTLYRLLHTARPLSFIGVSGHPSTPQCVAYPDAIKRYRRSESHTALPLSDPS